MDAIVLEEFSAFYQHKKDYYVALEKLSLRVKEGEFLAVAGPSGCGKTTLLRSVMGMTKLTTGSLLVNSRDVQSIDFFKENIGYVSQEYNLYPSMTVYENLAYPLQIMGASPEEIDTRVRDMARQVGIGMLLTRKPRQLSGGQQQCVSIARALIKNPRLLLMDEPFSNVNPAARTRLYEMLRTYHRQQRPTILLVTHALQEALALTDRVLLLEDGLLKQDLPTNLAAGYLEAEL